MEGSGDPGRLSCFDAVCKKAEYGGDHFGGERRGIFAELKYRPVIFLRTGRPGFAAEVFLEVQDQVVAFFFAGYYLPPGIRVL